ncbi:hypothetical protein RRG08_040055 [Elysia crispata]|uniref:Uncharacterized protein n=1 Tax=Elysia crispata TaxID=231223 RepID=A0AAE1CN00_9GAST|nr:hypothetical protein RRG08_040055 [Elysia crispata]
MSYQEDRFGKRAARVVTRELAHSKELCRLQEGAQQGASLLGALRSPDQLTTKIDTCQKQLTCGAAYSTIEDYRIGRGRVRSGS